MKKWMITLLVGTSLVAPMVSLAEEGGATSLDQLKQEMRALLTADEFDAEAIKKKEAQIKAAMREAKEQSAPEKAKRMESEVEKAAPPELVIKKRAMARLQGEMFRLEEQALEIVRKEPFDQGKYNGILEERRQLRDKWTDKFHEGQAGLLAEMSREERLKAFRVLFASEGQIVGADKASLESRLSLLEMQQEFFRSTKKIDIKKLNQTLAEIRQIESAIKAIEHDALVEKIRRKN